MVIGVRFSFITAAPRLLAGQAVAIAVHLHAVSVQVPPALLNPMKSTSYMHRPTQV